MHYPLIITEKCNLNCRYCYEKSLNEFENDLDKKFRFDFSEPADWISEIEKGNVLKFYPFLTIVESLLKNQPTKLRCGAGHSGYAITTSGKIVLCPIMNCIEDFKAGTLETDPQKLRKFQISECKDCEERDLCGGRCMYWRKAKL